MKSVTILVLMTILIVFSACNRKQVAPDMGKILMPSIIPKPEKIEIQDGIFHFNENVQIYMSGDTAELRPVADYLNHWFEINTGCRLVVGNKTMINRGTGKILLRTGLNREEIGEEGYVLSVTPGEIRLESNNVKGIFWAIQTLRQLFPFEYSNNKNQKNEILIPALRIEDKPRYSWRGMMLDVSRHFFPKEFIIQLIDNMAMYKLNTFHWHLGDDQGWRLEIKKYPKLTEISSWRVDREDRHWNDRPSQEPGEQATYGGFYTQEEIREIVEYAKNRFITIVPEIEMPGHTVAVLAAYPQYSCTGGPFTVLPGGYWPISNIFCAGNDSTFSFIQDILSEVIELFPGEFIHIGGDEADKSNWKKCAKCQTRIETEGLHNEHELQSYFIKRIENFINKNGKKIIGWDEILEGGLAPRATVMSWRGFEGGIAAARSGHDVVMTPTSHCYFDYYQGKKELEPLAIGGYLPLKKVYHFEPTPDNLTSAESKHILGGQANLWTEYIPNPEHAEYMIFPRIGALAEVVWTAKKMKNWNDFTLRIENEMARLGNLGINYAKSSSQISIQGSYNTGMGQYEVKMNTELPQFDIFYTIDGSEPDTAAQEYRNPVELGQSAVIKARAYKNGNPVSTTEQISLKLHKATGKKVELRTHYAERYSAGGPEGLTNSMKGSTNYGDHHWQGYDATDLDAKIDLGKRTLISSVCIGFLQDTKAWIFFPKKVTIEISLDGMDFRKIAEIINEPPGESSDVQIKEFSAEFPEQQTRYVRVIAESLGNCPDWHVGSGDNAWLFVDEIIVN